MTGLRTAAGLTGRTLQLQSRSSSWGSAAPTGPPAHSRGTRPASACMRSYSGHRIKPRRTEQLMYTGKGKQSAPTLSGMPYLACRASNCLSSSWLSFLSSSSCSLRNRRCAYETRWAGRMNPPFNSNSTLSSLLRNKLDKLPIPLAKLLCRPALTNCCSRTSKHSQKIHKYSGQVIGG